MEADSRGGRGRPTLVGDDEVRASRCMMRVHLFTLRSECRWGLQLALPASMLLLPPPLLLLLL